MDQTSPVRIKYFHPFSIQNPKGECFLLEFGLKSPPCGCALGGQRFAPCDVPQPILLHHVTSDLAGELLGYRLGGSIRTSLFGDHVTLQWPTRGPLPSSYRTSGVHWFGQNKGGEYLCLFNIKIKMLLLQSGPCVVYITWYNHPKIHQYCNRPGTSPRGKQANTSPRHCRWLMYGIGG